MPRQTTSYNIHMTNELIPRHQKFVDCYLVGPNGTNAPIEADIFLDHDMHTMSLAEAKPASKGA